MRTTQIAIAALIMLPLLSLASMFEADVTVYHDGVATEHNFSFNSMQDAIDAFSDDFLEENFSQYSDTDSAEGQVNLRGLTATFTYNMAQPAITSNGEDLSTLEIYIPGVVDQIFYGTDKNDLDQQAEEWFKGNDGGSSTITKIYQAMVSQTPYDPIAGNPNSLEADMIHLAFTTGQSIDETSLGSSNLFGIGSYYDYSEGDNTIQSLSVPLSYAHSFASGKRILLIDMPLYFYHYDDSTSYSGEISMGLKNIINRYWSLTPTIAVGGLGSEDMGSVSLVYSGFLNSTLNLPKNNWIFSLYNMAGYLKTGNISFDDYNIDYHLSNWAYNNGVGIHYRFSHYLTGLSYAYTYVAGSSWYYDHYNTVGVDFATRKRTDTLNYSPITFNFSYTFAEDGYSMYSGGLKYLF